MKYQVGDDVIVRDDLVIGQTYGEIPCERAHLMHEIVQISEVCGYYYFVNDNRLPYTDEMIKRVASVEDITNFIQSKMDDLDDMKGHE